MFLDQKSHARIPRSVPDCSSTPAVIRRSRSAPTAPGQHPGGWSVTGVLTVKGRAAPVELTVTGVSAEDAAIVFRAQCTVDRHAHGITMMAGMAGRRLSVQIAARATRA
jgi:polyisoprenoid-binding protein YceI